MLKWILGGAAVLFLGPPLLRAIAANPVTVRSAADLTERARGRAIDLTRRGASAAYSKVRGKMNGTFAGVMCGDC